MPQSPLPLYAAIVCLLTVSLNTCGHAAETTAKLGDESTMHFRNVVNARVTYPNSTSGVQEISLPPGWFVKSVELVERCKFGNSSASYSVYSGGIDLLSEDKLHEFEQRVTDAAVDADSYGKYQGKLDELYKKLLEVRTRVKSNHSLVKVSWSCKHGGTWYNQEGGALVLDLKVTAVRFLTREELNEAKQTLLAQMNGGRQKLSLLLSAHDLQPKPEADDAIKQSVKEYGDILGATLKPYKPELNGQLLSDQKLGAALELVKMIPCDASDLVSYADASSLVLARKRGFATLITETGNEGRNRFTIQFPDSLVKSKIIDISPADLRGVDVAVDTAARKFTNATVVRSCRLADKKGYLYGIALPHPTKRKGLKLFMMFPNDEFTYLSDKGDANYEEDALLTRVYSEIQAGTDTPARPFTSQSTVLGWRFRGDSIVGFVDTPNTKEGRLIRRIVKQAE